MLTEIFRAVLCCAVLHSVFHNVPCFAMTCGAVFALQLVDICRTQLDVWSAAGGPINIAAEGKDLSFEFSTQLLVSGGVFHGSSNVYLASTVTF